MDELKKVKKNEGITSSDDERESITEFSFNSKHDLMALAKKLSDGHYDQNSETRGKILKFIADKIKKMQ